jgi:hypothetical protein
MKKIISVLFIALFALSFISLGLVSADEGDDPYYSNKTLTVNGGKLLDQSVINGPSSPPSGFELERKSVKLPQPNSIQGTNTLAVPAFDWSFGCSATSGAMIAGYYDRNGFPNMYSGPTNSGVMPLDSSVWSNWTDGYGDTYGQCPLTASHNGLDGRTTRGSLDDYWVKYDSSVQDPYITNGWSQHSFGSAIGDYMRTSQSTYDNTDGSTTFYTWTTSPDRLTCSDMENYSITNDGTYGRKLFYEARGYTVTDCYNQKTNNNSGGFTYAMYKAEIDAGRPVMINFEGHTVVGIGYSDPSTVYIHDTWDYLTHSFTWGSSYSGMALLSVSIVNLEENTSAALNGAVSDEDSGTPIVGATVSALGASQTTSGAGGAYTLSLSAGVYTITTSASGYLTDTITDVLITEATTTTLNINLTPEATGEGFLTGAVTDKDSGNPIVGATIEALGASQTTSGTGGVYSLSLPAGSYTVAASALGYSTTTVTGVKVLESITATVDMSLAPLDSLWFAPATLETTILSGTSTTVPLTLTNNSSSIISFTLQEEVGGFQSYSTSDTTQNIIQAAGYSAENARHAPAIVGRSSPANTINSVDTILLNEGFEGGVVPPTGWSEKVTNTGYNWKIYAGGSPYNGSFAADIDYDSALNNQDEWLLSPEIDPIFGTLSFWSQGSIYWCKNTYNNCDLNVWLVVGEVGGGDDIFVGKGDDVWPGNWTWSQSVFNLNPLLPGVPFRIGFEYTGKDGAQIILDAITLDLGTEIPWLTQSPITGTIPALQSQVIDVTFDASIFARTGQYTGTLHILSDDAVNPDLSVPLVMNVYDEYTISGDAGVGGATLSYTDGAPMTTTADSNGLYSFIVPEGWSGTVTPSKSGCIFTPPNRFYTNVKVNQTAQDYVAKYLVYLPFLSH